MALSFEQKEIYARNIKLKEVGEEGQQKLIDAKVLVVGCGGLGSPVLLYLTMMGIGTIGLCDGDTVSLSNLNRQILYTMDDIDKPKAEQAAKRLRAANPNANFSIYPVFFNEENAEQICKPYDIVVDCLDNFETRIILNDVCIKLGIPFVHAGVSHYGGQLMTIVPGKSACLRCIFPHGNVNQPKVLDNAILGATAGVMASMQVMEVFKYLIGLPVNDNGFIFYDGLKMTCEKITLDQLPSCACRSAKLR